MDTHTQEKKRGINNDQHAPPRATLASRTKYGHSVGIGLSLRLWKADCAKERPLPLAS